MSVAAVAGAVAGFLAHPARQCCPAPSIHVSVHAPVDACCALWFKQDLFCHAPSMATLQAADACASISWWPVSTALNLCPCYRTGHLGWHPEPRAGLQISHHHCSLGSMQQAEERCMAEPGSSSDEWERGGKVFGCLEDLIAGGDSPELRDYSSEG